MALSTNHLYGATDAEEEADQAEEETYQAIVSRYLEAAGSQSQPVRCLKDKVLRKA